MTKEEIIPTESSETASCLGDETKKNSLMCKVVGSCLGLVLLIATGVFAIANGITIAVYLFLLSFIQKDIRQDYWKQFETKGEKIAVWVVEEEVIWDEKDHIRGVKRVFQMEDPCNGELFEASIEEKQVELERQEQTKYEAEQLRRLAQGRADAFEIEAKGRANAAVSLAEGVSPRYQSGFTSEVFT